MSHDIPPFPAIPDVYEDKDQCFPTWNYDPVPKGFSFPLEFIQFCIKWEESLTDDIKEHVDKYSDNGHADTDSISWRDSHEAAHDSKSSRDAIRLGVDLMLKHNVGTIDLSDSLWQTLNEEVGRLVWNVRRLKEKTQGDNSPSITASTEDGPTVEVTAIEASSIAELINKAGSQMPKIVAAALIKSLRKMHPRQWEEAVARIEDPTDMGVPDDVRTIYFEMKNEGLL